MAEGLPDLTLEQIVRDEAGLIAASLTRRIGDFDIAEEALQDAIVTALRVWRRDGVPPNPAAWLTLTARRNAIDRLRRRASGVRVTEALAQQAQAHPGESEDSTDERLPLLFAACHPALAPGARLALTLRAVVGLTTAEIARAFLIPEATLAQRIVRAKRKIGQAGIPLRVVPTTELPARLDDVLTVVYLTYNAGYLRPATDAQRHLANDAVWLAELVARELPSEPEAVGLLALLTFLEARAAARFDCGRLVPLRDQARAKWDRDRIVVANHLLERAALRRRPGRFQLQAALAACHAEADSYAETDWLQIVTLYDLLCRLDSSPVVRLNRAIAIREVNGPEAALAEVNAVAERLDGYHLLHATRAYLLTALGRREEARHANRRALDLATNPAEQQLLRGRADEAS